MPRNSDDPKINPTKQMCAERVCSLSGLSLAVKVVKNANGISKYECPWPKKHPKKTPMYPMYKSKNKTKAKAYMYLARGGYVGAGGGGGG
jgi:hypothetical protein